MAPAPPNDSADASVEQVLEEDVLGVLCAHGARLEERKPELHEEDEHTADEKPEGVASSGREATRDGADSSVDDFLDSRVGSHGDGVSWTCGLLGRCTPAKCAENESRIFSSSHRLFLAASAQNGRQESR